MRTWNAVKMLRRSLTGLALREGAAGRVMHTQNDPKLFLSPSELNTWAWCPEAHRLKAMNPVDSPSAKLGRHYHTQQADEVRRDSNTAVIRTLLIITAIVAAAFIALFLWG